MSAKSVNSGFTLLEVIIAVTILAFISIFTARMIQNGVQAKTKIQAEIDRTAGITGALQLMTRDVQQAFNYRDVNTELYNAAQKQRRKALIDKKKGKTQGEDKNKDGVPDDQQPDLFPPDDQSQLSPDDEEKMKFKEEKVYGRFIGEADKLNFTSLNNFRGIKNLQQSDQTEIGYYLENCSSPAHESSSQCLWRRTSPYLDEEVTDGGKRSVLLENVKDLKFRYLGAKEEDWLEHWDSVHGEEIARNKFPVAVEITMTVTDAKDKSRKETTMTVVAPLFFPNNKPDQKSDVVN